MVAAERARERGRPPRVVIVGGGFGGLYAARGLRRAPVEVTVVDRRNHHVFQPLLYQVATAVLNPSDIAAPIRRILRRQANTRVLLAEVTAIDAEHKTITLSGGEQLGYDFLVLATGSAPSYFGHPEWGEHAPGLKSLEDALEIRRRILLAYEAAERESDPERRREWLTFVVVGGGPTGIELAGALAEISRHALGREFRHIDPKEARILLVEGMERVLPSFPPPLSDKARRELEALGVSVLTGSLIDSVDEHGVTVGDRRINARTVLWAAGVSAPSIARELGAPLDRSGRVVVHKDLTVPGRDDILVIGDLAAFEQDGEFVPGVAPVAIQQGRHAARTILRRLEGLPPKPFRYVDKGMLVSIRRGVAVALVRGLRFSGFLAWVVWLLVHIFWLIGFRNRLLVFMQWAWAYATHDRGARLITGPTGLPVSPPIGGAPPEREVEKADARASSDAEPRMSK